MINKLCVAAVGSLFFAASAYAAPPACDEMTTVSAPNVLNGTTVGAGGGIEVIGPYSLANEAGQKVWSFVAGDNVDGSFTVTATPDWGWGLFVTTGCSVAPPAPIQSLATGEASTTLTLDPARYTAGTTYYVILSGLRAAEGAMPLEGGFSINVTPNLPVSLQNFSVD
ncbi:MAG: hypothetical protein J0H15_10670 [Xanthomonadales bacterium]|nr:hypothetical protein [Xanthomonadales bacterium]